MTKNKLKNNVLISVDSLPTFLCNHDWSFLSILHLLSSGQSVCYFRAYHCIGICPHELNLSQTLTLLTSLTYFYLILYNLTQHTFCHFLGQLFHFIFKINSYQHFSFSSLSICSISSGNNLYGFLRTLLILASILTHFVHHDNRLWTVFCCYCFRFGHLWWR